MTSARVKNVSHHTTPASEQFVKGAHRKARASLHSRYRIIELRNVAGRAHSSHLNSIMPKLGTSRRTMYLTIWPSMVATNMDMNVRHTRANVCMDNRHTSGVQKPGTISRSSFLSWIRNSRSIPGPAALSDFLAAVDFLLPAAGNPPPPAPFVLLLSLDSPDGRRPPPSVGFFAVPSPPHTFNTIG